MTTATDAQLSSKHTFVCATLTHHGISQAHTTLMADLIHGLEVLDAAAQPDQAAEIAALRQDSLRYRWLRDNTESDWAICEWQTDPVDSEGYYRDCRAPAIVDAAIDAVIAQAVQS